MSWVVSLHSSQCDIPCDASRLLRVGLAILSDDEDALPVLRDQNQPLFEYWLTFSGRSRSIPRRRRHDPRS